MYALCRAGVVSYYNGGYNHRHCGRASGKLYWICRAGKPVLSNDNLSISGLVREHGLGFDLTRAASLDALDDAGPAGGAAMGARARAFYATEAQAMSATLDALLADNGTDPAQGGSR